MIDERTIRQWWDVLKGDGAPVEFRVFQDNATYSGYYTDVEDAIKDLASFDRGAIYATLNPCKEACASRVQGGKMMKIGKNPTTSGNDIDHRGWVLIDIDPERAAGTNATDGEKKHAEMMMREVYRYLRNVGFQSPVVADSANGYHLYYKVDLENTQENSDLISKFLKVLDMFFSDDKAKIDTAVYDPNRIAKVIGTMSAKGRNTATRPQRLSSFVHVPDEIKTTGQVYFKKVADQLPEAPRPTRENNYSVEKFDVDSFILEHGIEVVKRTNFKDGEKIVLKECPFDSNHQASAIFKLGNGAVGFKCFHNSCSSYGWKDVRLRFDPMAYSRKDFREFKDKHRFDRSPAVTAPITEKEELGNKWEQPDQVKYVNPNSFPYIPTGITEIDKAMLGLTLGDVTIISGLASSGKTSLIDYVILNAADKGFKIAAWSGELQDFRFMSWLDQMAAGKTNVVPMTGYENIYYAPRNISEKVNRWLNGKFWLYNNNYGNKWSQLLNDIKEALAQFHPQLIVIDNLTALDLDNDGMDKNDRQKSLINEIKGLAKSENIHVILVCHPRKEQSFHMLRMESIAGSSDLVNLCDNVLIAHRSGRDLKIRMLEFFSESVADEYQYYDSLVEVAKNRSHGCTKLVGLFFETETRRFKNTNDENIVYGWDDTTPKMMIGSMPVGTEFDNGPTDDLPL